MKKDSKQTMVLIGIALLVAAGVLLYISLNQPRIYSEAPAKSTTTVTVTEEQTAEPDTTEEETTEAETYAETAEEPETVNSGKTEETEEKTYKYPLNINTASVEALMSIDGLGEVRASAIVEYREYLGKYTSVEQIMQIKGIDEEIYKKVAGYLTV